MPKFTLTQGLECCKQDSISVCAYLKNYISNLGHVFISCVCVCVWGGGGGGGGLGMAWSYSDLIKTDDPDLD